MYECRGAFSYDSSFLEQKENSPNFPIKVKNASNANQLIVCFFYCKDISENYYNPIITFKGLI